MYTWGLATESLGHGERTSHVRPTRVAAMIGKRVIRVAISSHERSTFMLLLTDRGDVYSCGSNRYDTP